MTYSNECTQFEQKMEHLIENGFEDLGISIPTLLEESRQDGYANGYRAKTMRTRYGEVELAIP